MNTRIVAFSLFLVVVVGCAQEEQFVQEASVHAPLGTQSGDVLGGQGSSSSAGSSQNSSGNSSSVSSNHSSSSDRSSSLSSSSRSSGGDLSSSSSSSSASSKSSSSSSSSVSSSGSSSSMSSVALEPQPSIKSIQYNPIASQNTLGRVFLTYTISHLSPTETLAAAPVFSVHTQDFTVLSVSLSGGRYSTDGNVTYNQDFIVDMNYKYVPYETRYLNQEWDVSVSDQGVVSLYKFLRYYDVLPDQSADTADGTYCTVYPSYCFDGTAGAPYSLP